MRLTTIQKDKEIFKNLIQILFCSIIICSLSCTKNTVNIQSYILRDRVIVLDRVLMKKALYVSFSFSRSLKQHGNMNVHGLLLNNDKIVSETSLKAFNENSGNLVFDLPYQIPDGQYTIRIDAFAGNGELAASGFVSVERFDLKGVFNPGSKNSVRVFEEVPPRREPEGVKPTSEDKSMGYILFSRSPLEYVFPGSKPKESEIIEHITVKLVRNEFEPINFSLYPLEDLGMVKVSATDLKSAKGFISKDKMKVACVEVVQETIGLPKGKFLN